MRLRPGGAVRSARAMTLAAAAAVLCLLTTSAQSRAEDQSLADAQRLLEAGRVVEAKSVLLVLRKTTPEGPEQDRIVETLAAADRRLRFMDEVELSLQKGELALKEGDLRLAETHASAARRSEKASPEQRRRASEVLDQSAALKKELEPVVAPTLLQAISDFDQERYPQAKAGFASIVRSGVRLTQDQMAEINRYQDRIYDLERKAGKSFEAEYVPLGVLGGAKSVAVAALAAPQQEGGGAGGSQTPPPAGDALFEEAAKFDAQRVLSEADSAFTAGRYNEAAEKYTLATTTYARHLSPEQLTGARNRLAEARALLGGPGVGTIDDVINQRRIMREEATAVVDNLVGESRQALARGDISTARNQAAQARLKWNDAYANGLFSEEQFSQKSAQIQDLVKQIDAAAETQTRAEIAQRESALKEEEARARAQQQSEREARINENLDRLRALQAEQKYAEALQVVDQILFLDPTNPAALLLKDVLRDVMLYKDFEDIRRKRQLSYAVESNDMERSLIVPESLLAYPPDWPELSFRRGEVQSFVESEADRRVMATLDTRRIPASFNNNTLEDVVTFVATVTNLNVDVDWESLSKIGVERDKPISLELREVPARVVLDRVLEKAQPDSFSKVGWAVNDGVLVVAADEALRKNRFVVIYDIRDLLFQIPDFQNAPELNLDQVLNQGQQGGGGSSGSIFREQGTNTPEGPSEDDLMERILEIIQTNVDFEGWRDNGGDTGVVQELNGNLIITNTARNHREIQGLLNQLRQIRAVQINVEARFLAVRQDFFERIAFDLDVYFNADNSQFSAVRRQLEAFGQGSLANEGLSVVPSDIVTGRNGANTGYVFTGLDQNGNPQYAFQAQPFSIPAPNNLSVVPVQQNSSGIVSDRVDTVGTAFATAINALNPAMAVAFSFLDDVQVDFLMEATQADERTVRMQAPRLTFSNGKSANISVITQTGFVSDLTPVVGTSSVAFDPTIGRINSGFTLSVRGVVSADRRYVTMTVETAVSSLESLVPQTLTAAAAGTGGTQGGGEATGTIQVPTLNVTSINTGVTVPDKGTVLLGGQRLVTEVEIESGVPVLSKLPIINRFFTNRSEMKEESTLLILIKPTIIIQNEEEEKNFPGLLDKLRNPFR